MKLKFVMLAMLFAPAVAMAGLNLSEPADLMQKAQQDRIALREVMLDLEMNLSEMRDQPTFEKYFFMLDELGVLAVRLKLDEIYPKMTERLGLKMSGVGMRWLDVTKDTPAKLQYYVKWMDIGVLSRFLDTISYQIAFIKDRALLATMAQNVESILPLVDERAQGQVYLPLGYRRVVADAAISILRNNKDLSPVEVSFWIGKLVIPAAISEYLDILNQDIYGLNSVNKEFGREYLSRLLALNGQVEKMSQAAPSWLINGIGDAVNELLIRAVRFELVLDQKQFFQAVSILKIRSTLSLMQQWSAQEKMPSQAYAEFYMSYTSILIAHARQLGMNKEVDEFAKWLGRASSPLMSRKLNLEGVYTLTNETGEKWFFTITHARENMLVASLGTATGSLYKVFYNITYSAELAIFVASEREADTDHAMNSAIKFSVNEKGQIKLVDPYIRVGSQNYTGQKTLTYADLWEKPQAVDGIQVDGTYAGTLTMADGDTMPVKVIVTSFGGYTIGRLDSPTGLTIEFSIGTKATDGVLVLTSGRNSHGASWFQLRGYLTPEGYNAQVVVGARPAAPKISFLKRIQD